MNSTLYKFLPFLFLPIYSLNAQPPGYQTKVLTPKSINKSVTSDSPADTVLIETIPKAVTPATDLGISREHYTQAATYTSNFVSMGDGITYAGSKKGITMWDNYAPLVINTENSRIPDDHVTALALDGNRNLWIGTLHDGIVIGVQRDIKPFKVRKVITRDQNITSIYVDEKGLVWVVYGSGSIECFKDELSVAYFGS